MVLNANASMPVEIVNLNSTVTSCNPFPAFPASAEGATGILLGGKIPLVCDGTPPPTNGCYLYEGPVL